MQNYCSHCGSRLKDGANFCVKCGKPVRQNGAVNQAPAEIQKPESEEEKNRRRLEELRELIHNDRRHSVVDILFDSPFFDYDYAGYILKLREYDLNEEKQEQFKIDWLLESINSGNKLEDYGEYVFKSAKEGLPYYAETEIEFNELTWHKQIDCFDIDETWQMCSRYMPGSLYNCSAKKTAYWKHKLVEMAFDGDMEAQAELCSNTIVFGEETKRYQEVFLNEIIEKANTEDHNAELALSEMRYDVYPISDSERFDLYVRASKGDLSNAWYKLESYYSVRLMEANGNASIDGKSVTLSPEELEKIKEEKNRCLLNGAKANNGSKAVKLQHQLALNYWEGQDGFPKDLATAKYWLQKASENGDLTCRRWLETERDFQ